MFIDYSGSDIVVAREVRLIMAVMNTTSVANEPCMGGGSPEVKLRPDQ
jgi:hypothetical protein